MPNSGPTSASLIICESVLTEHTGSVSAIRIMDILRVGSAATTARFFVLTYLHSHSFDSVQHTLKVQMLGLRGETWVSVADAPDQNFGYAYRIDPSAPGAFMLTTEFGLNLTTLGPLGTFYVQALVDGVMVAQTPLTLRRVA
jgi:hypothetical protein